MRQLMDVRYPVYAQADLTVESHEAPHDRVVQSRSSAALDGDWLARPPPRSHA